MTTVDLANELELFHGEATVRLARVYAQYPTLTGCTLTGYLSGPHCLHSSTLPTTIAFRDKGPGATLLAEAILPDPCFWSPEVPALYTAQIELRRGSEVLATVQRSLGLRAISIRGKSFYSEGRRVVLRGAHQQAVQPTELLAWRDAGATMLVDNPSTALCDEASRVGVFLLAKLSQAEAQDTANVARLAQQAAVVALVLPSEMTIDQTLRQHAARLLLAQKLPSAQQPTFDKEADFLLVASNDAMGLARIAAETDKPVLALGQISGVQPLWEARSACDQLQAQLASHGDFAGYLVST